jgi:hypothetical protein
MKNLLEPLRRVNYVVVGNRAVDAALTTIAWSVLLFGLASKAVKALRPHLVVALKALLNAMEEPPSPVQPLALAESPAPSPVVSAPAVARKRPTRREPAQHKGFLRG